MKLLNRKTLAAVGLALWSLACSDTPNNPAALPDSSATDLRIANMADTATVQVGQTRQLTAKIVSYSGSTLNGTITWSSSANSIATVSSTGLVKGIAAGQAVITATYYWSKARTTVTVVAAGTAPKPLVATVAVAAPSASVAAGATVQATATARDSANAVVSGSTFTWASSNATVATVSATGLITGVAQGSATISATSSGKTGTLAFTVTAVATTPPQQPPPPPPTGGAPAPTLLPVAAINMPMNVAAYNALNVPAMAAGGSYRDPVTSVRVTKLTSASFPATGNNWGHDYFEGGYEVSLPYTGDGVTRAVLAMGSNGGNHYLLDVIPGSSVSRSRALSGSFNPNSDLAFTFSSNPSTPYYAFVLNGGTLRRFDMRTMAEAPGNGFPLTSAGGGAWLQNCANDAEFNWMSGSTIYHYTPATARLLTLVDGNANEPRFDRGCRYVGLSMNSPDNGLRVWDTQSNTVTWSSSGSQPFAHNASLQHMWVGSDWNNNWPFAFTSVTPTANSWRTEWGPSIGPAAVGNGGWNQAGDQRNAYTVWNSYGSLSGNAGWADRQWTAPGGIVLVTVNGDKRLLGHPYSNQTSYFNSVWPKFSSDGKVVLFTSDMMTGRYDLFLMELPSQ